MKKFYNLEACSGSKLFDTLMIFLNKYFVKKKLKKNNNTTDALGYSMQEIN